MYESALPQKCSTVSLLSEVVAGGVTNVSSVARLFAYVGGRGGGPRKESPGEARAALAAVSAGEREKEVQRLGERAMELRYSDLSFQTS